MLKTYSFPDGLERSPRYRVTMYEGDLALHVPTFQNEVADFAMAEFTGAVTVQVDVLTIEDLDENLVSIRPLSRNIRCETQGRRITFALPGPENLKVNIEGFHDFYLYFSAPELAQSIPNPQDESVFWFGAGQTYEVGTIELRTNQTLYLEGGAVVRGHVHGTGDNIRVCGRGILDGGYRRNMPHVRTHTIQLEECTNATIQDITILNPPSWIVVLGACEHIVCDNLKELGLILSTDGIDVCGSSHVEIRNCFIKCNDDCVVIKSFRHSLSTVDWSRDVEHVRVTNCMFETVTNGCAFEIGHELSSDHVRNIIFENCDVLSINGFGSVFSIQNTGKATVSDVLYRNIRIDHCFEKLLNLRVMDSMFSKDTLKGKVRGIHFQDIFWRTFSYNLGYTVSIIGGMDEEHCVEDVSFENFTIDGQRITRLEQIYLFTNHAHNVRISRG